MTDKIKQQVLELLDVQIQFYTRHIVKTANDWNEILTSREKIHLLHKIYVQVEAL